MATVTEVRVPDIGDFKGVNVIEVLVKPGDTIAVEDPLLTLESDKASMDVPAPLAGTVKEVKTKVGDKISQGDLILLLETEENVTAAAPAATPKPAVAQAPAATAPADSPAELGYGGTTGAATATATAPTATVTAPTATATARSGSQVQEVRVPDIGNFKGVGI